MRLTWFDSNSWLIEVGDQRILLDPWLVGPLVFGNATWLFKGEKNRQFPIPMDLSLLLLSQGLEDHAHPPTLQHLDPQLPVVASANGAKVVKKLGFQQVTALLPGQTFTLNNQVEIRAFSGSLVGPQLVENAYLLTDLTTGYRLYYEPHGFHSPELKSIGKIDVILTPVVGASLLHLIPVLNGQKTTVELCQWLQPEVIIPTAAAVDIRYQGLIGYLFREEGSIATFENLLSRANLQSKVINPQLGEVIALPVV
ncbi:MAG: MBL fold metallo-hydrolase [Snowella sp.]|nr:MBL fold metallo-hydrolase [Snowella sp.]